MVQWPLSAEQYACSSKWDNSLQGFRSKSKHSYRITGNFTGRVFNSKCLTALRLNTVGSKRIELSQSTVELFVPI